MEPDVIMSGHVVWLGNSFDVRKRGPPIGPIIFGLDFLRLSPEVAT